MLINSIMIPLNQWEFSWANRTVILIPNFGGVIISCRNSSVWKNLRKIITAPALFPSDNKNYSEFTFVCVTRSMAVPLCPIEFQIPKVRKRSLSFQLTAERTYHNESTIFGHI